MNKENKPKQSKWFYTCCSTLELENFDNEEDIDKIIALESQPMQTDDKITSEELTKRRLDNLNE